MKIEKSGYYEITNAEELIEIDSNISVVLFDSGISVKKIIVWEKGNLMYLWYPTFPLFEKQILLSWNEAKAKINILNFSWEQPRELKILGEVFSSFSELSFDIVSLLASWGKSNIQTMAKIDENREKSKLSIIQKNIFLGTNASVQGTPSLYVASSDVEAHHACQIEKIGEEKIFYLRSRGIPKKKALCMIISSYIEETLFSLKENDPQKYREIFKEIMNKSEFK